MFIILVMNAFFNSRAYGDISMASDMAPGAERLVTISLNTLNGRAASLEDLAELRKREENENSRFLW